MPREIAIGDIHGCRNALVRLICKINLKLDDVIILLGDYIDRGHNSIGVIEYILSGIDQGYNVVPLIGNHEQLMEWALAGGRSDWEFWTNNGGDRTLTSYGITDTRWHTDAVAEAKERIPKRHMDFFKGLVKYHETKTHIYVHANYDPLLPMKAQNEHLILWGHIRGLPPPPHISGKTVVVGHTPGSELRDWGHVKCIDTGVCFWPGNWRKAVVPNARLTALSTDGEVWEAYEQSEGI